MNDKIFSLWFVIIIISNVGAAFAEDADKNIWWDAKAARAKNHNKEVQKDGQVTESKEEKEQKEKKELKLLEKERKKQEREKEKRHRKKIKDEENRIKEEEKKIKRARSSEAKKSEQEEKALEKKLVKEQRTKKDTSCSKKDKSCSIKKEKVKDKKKQTSHQKKKQKKEEQEKQKRIDAAYKQEQKEIRKKQKQLDHQEKLLKKERKIKKTDQLKLQKKEKARLEKRADKVQREKKRSVTLAAIENALEERREDKRWEIAQRKELVSNWQVMHAKQVEQDYQNGRYADLYKLPAWPSWSQFFNQQHGITMRSYYTHADDAYNSCGANDDVSILHFGQKAVALKDVLLVSTLAAEGVNFSDDTKINNVSTVIHYDSTNSDGLFTYNNQKINSKDITGEKQAEQSRYLAYLAPEEIDFRARVEQYGCDLTFARSFWNDTFSAGFVVPVLYKKHRLQAFMELGSEQAKERIHALALEGDFFQSDGEELPSFTPEGNSITPVPNAFQRRYGASTDLLIKDIMKAKGFERLGGSVMGFGDVSLFINYTITSLLFDRAVVGARIKLPTGKEAQTNRVWAPELGTGLTELSIFGSIALTHSKYCNPHGFIEGSFGLLGHVERRVPGRVTLTDERATVLAGVANSALNKAFSDLAFAERVMPRAGKGFSAFDSSIAGLADRVTTVRMAKGFQLDMRVGNIIEECFSRRGFLDIHYSLMLKRKDRVSQPDLQEWDAETLWRNTQRVAHTIGADYSYQYDAATRASCGVWYIFAGKWMPKEAGIHCSVHHSF